MKNIIVIVALFVATAFKSFAGCGEDIASVSNAMCLLFIPITTPVLTSTNPPPATTNIFAVQFDWISGQIYTNKTGGTISISQNITWTTAAVAGAAKMNLVVVGETTNSVGENTIFSLTVGRSSWAQVQLSVTNNQVYYFTNISSGLGNSASIVPGSGKLTYLKAQ